MRFLQSNDLRNSNKQTNFHNRIIIFEEIFNFYNFHWIS